MSFTHTVNETVKVGSVTHSSPRDLTGSSRVSISETISIANNVLVNCSLDVSAIKSVYILSDQNMTLKTNSSGSPAETISLVANVPLTWYTNCYYTNLLATDITALYLTNASAAAASFTLEALTDATP
jgi:hypothetical protein